MCFKKLNERAIARLLYGRGKTNLPASSLFGGYGEKYTREWHASARSCGSLHAPKWRTCLPARARPAVSKAHLKGVKGNDPPEKLWNLEAMWWFLKSPIPIVSGILDSLSWIMDLKPRINSGFHRPKFPGFWIPRLLSLLKYYFSDINNTITTFKKGFDLG